MDAGEAGHTPEINLSHKKPIVHLHTLLMAPLSLWWDPDAPDPLSGETLDPLEKRSEERRVGKECRL